MFPQTQEFRAQSLGQFSQSQEWRLKLAHHYSAPLLIWITRGQGVALFEGARRGVGAHNAFFLPAGALFSLDLTRQSTGQVVQFPAATPLRLPQMPRHLRIREAQVQLELTSLIEAAMREAQAQRPLMVDALEGHAALMSVWLRRQIMQDTHIPERQNAAARLSRAFCALLADRYTSVDVMADYARSLGVTPTHLTRCVKAATGKTAADLLTERVLHEARRLLVETQEPAKNIARYLGFRSAAYFTRFVQNHTGRTPSAIRKA